jgi:hypothetical protein
MKRFLRFSFILVLLLPIFLSAQTVTGKLVDQNGNGLAGLQLNLYINPNVYDAISNSNGFFTFDNVTEVKGNALPTGYGVSENYPNPFNPRTRLLITLPSNSRVNVKVLNILGQKVVKEIEGYYGAGTSSIDLELNGLPNGIYFARVYLDNKYTVVKKLMLMYGSQHLSSSNPGFSSFSGLNKSIMGYNSTLDTKIDSLVVTGSLIGRKVFTNLPSLIGNSLNLGNLTIVSGSDTVYVPIYPDWSVANGITYNNPQAILMGHEPFIYVCDTDNDRIVMLSTTGNVLGTLGIKKPIAIAEDYSLNLIVCAQIDTGSIPYSAVYKIDLLAVNHIIANATKKLILPRAVDIDYHPDVKYSAVTAFFDNSYYIARKGTQNISIYDPDNAILQFESVSPDSDSFLAIVHDIGALNSGLITANGINCMTSFSKKNLDFIATFDKNVPNETVFKAQWFKHFETQFSEGYRSAFNPSDGMAFVRPNRFGAPTGSCIDPTGNIYIADGDPGKDSVFKFSALGDELQSFGGPGVFSKPTGVAFFDQTLYVLDSQKNMIRRFILSTDLRR